QVRVTGVDLAPGIDDADHGSAAPVGRVITELAQPRAVAERAQIVDAEPAVAAQVLGTLTVHCDDPGMRFVYSRLTPPSLITLAQLAVWGARRVPKSAGLPGTSMPPSSARRALTFGSAKAALISLLSLSMISGGVPFGALIP